MSLGSTIRSMTSKGYILTISQSKQGWEIVVRSPYAWGYITGSSSYLTEACDKAATAVAKRGRAIDAGRKPMRPRRVRLAPKKARVRL